MTRPAPPLAGFFAAHPSVIRLDIARVQGSSPRNAGTEMYIAADALWGTIGGGQLEYMAIDAARQMLRNATRYREMDVPLGPEIGQCCGGRVQLRLSRMDDADKRASEGRAQRADAALPHVYVMGAGHVGRALADLFQTMPVKCILIDTRPEELALCRADVETRLSVLPEADVDTAPPGSAFVVLTHDHALDFLLASAALARGDAAYVGLIGSATKRARFTSWARDHCDGQDVGALVCPIGAGCSPDKRPAVIASFVLAEVMAALTTKPITSARKGATKMPAKGDQKRRGQKMA